MDVKIFTHYLDAALKLEQMAAKEHEQHLEEGLTKLAGIYRDLATERANKLGLHPPPFELVSRD